MNFNTRLRHRLAFALFLAPDKGGESGGGGKTLEQQLTSAREDLATAQSSLDAVTKERDSAKFTVTTLTSERDTLQTQFDSLAAEAKKAKDDLTTANATIGTLTADRDNLKSSSATKDARIKNMEALCGVKGVDPDAAPPSIEGGPGSSKHVFDQWTSATGAEKTRLFREHKAEIRAEGDRRSKDLA